MPESHVFFCVNWRLSQYMFCVDGGNISFLCPDFGLKERREFDKYLTIWVFKQGLLWRGNGGDDLDDYDVVYDCDDDDNDHDYNLL